MKIGRSILLSILLSVTSLSYIQAQSKTEVRAVWLTTNYGLDWPRHIANSERSRLAQQEELCTILDSLQAAHFNMVLLQVRSRGDVIYDSQIETASSTFSGTYGELPGYDPLAFAIDECHNRGMECHAWLVTFPVGTDRVVKAEGSRSVVKRHPELVKRFNGTWFLNPGNPETGDYLLSVVQELVNKYDIDGVHFDYIRYPGDAYNFPDKAEYKKYGGEFNSIEDWRRDNVNQVVYKIYDWVKKVKPWVQVSSSPLGKAARIAAFPDAKWTGYEMVYQDAREWMMRGKHDMVVPMMYYQNDNFYPFVCDWVDHSAGRYAVAGLGAYRMEDESDWMVSDVTKQIDYVRENGMAGCAFFRCANVVKNAGLFNALKNDYYKYPALLPPLTWLDKYVPAQPDPVVVKREGNNLVLTWAERDKTKPLTYTLYCSHTNRIDSDSAKCVLATHLTENRYVIPVDKTTDQGYLFSVSASTRYRNESPLSREVFYYCSEFKK